MNKVKNDNDKCGGVVVGFSIEKEWANELDNLMDNLNARKDKVQRFNRSLLLRLACKNINLKASNESELFIKI